jgi:hypothetical protein
MRIKASSKPIFAVPATFALSKIARNLLKKNTNGKVADGASFSQNAVPYPQNGGNRMKCGKIKCNKAGNRKSNF